MIALLRRAFALMLATVAIASLADVAYQQVVPGHRIELPRDEGAHPQFRGEWWYVTGWLQDEEGRPYGFQVTFFRHRPGVDEDNPSSFAAKQVLFAHASLSDPSSARLLRDEKIARAGFGLAEAREGSLDVHIDDWQLLRPAHSDSITAVASSTEFAFDLSFQIEQPPLLNGRNGWSQKTPSAESASYYYSLPQLRASGRISVQGVTHRVNGVAWLDHEWFSALLDRESQGWDWIGINFDDGAALMAFQMRDARGQKQWAAATLRAKGQPSQTFQPDEVDWRPLRTWRSPRTGFSYPVEWHVRIGDRTITLRPLFDDQENDARASAGTIYWEGAVIAYDESGRRLGKGYLELTGYGDRLRF